MLFVGSGFERKGLGPADRGLGARWRTRKAGSSWPARGTSARYQQPGRAPRHRRARRSGSGRGRTSSGSTPPPTPSRCPRATSPSATCISKPSRPACPCSRARGRAAPRSCATGRTAGSPPSPTVGPIARGPRRAPRRAGAAAGPRARGRPPSRFTYAAQAAGVHRPLRPPPPLIARRPPRRTSKPSIFIDQSGARHYTAIQCRAMLGLCGPPCSWTATAASPRRWATSTTRAGSACCRAPRRRSAGSTRRGSPR